jgi:restriction endonuclease S subunit
VVQLKDVDYDSCTIAKKLTSVAGTPISEKYTLNETHVLFIAKGSNNLAVLPPQTNSRCIASSVFFVLHCDATKVLPAYLAWYINQPAAQQYLDSNKEGTYTQNISKQALLDLEIPIPTLQIQQKIIQASTLLQQEQTLLKEITSKRNLLISTKLNSLIQ